MRIDSRESYQRVMEFVQEFVTEFADKVEYYPGERPIFDLYSVEDEIQKALSRKVQLKSGGYVIIDQTEAMTTIDINTRALSAGTLKKPSSRPTWKRRGPSAGNYACATSAASSLSILSTWKTRSTMQVHRMLEKMLGGTTPRPRSPACRSWAWLR